LIWRNAAMARRCIFLFRLLPDQPIFKETAMRRDVSTEKLMDDLRLVVTDAEELLKATAGNAGEKVTVARERAEESIRAARARLADAGREAAERTREAARVTDAYVHDNPWVAVGIAAAVGALIGSLLGRR
jgi:ElaB/YqjD/DUF883 family membrane-anchored ribosome-binding protein